MNFSSTPRSPDSNDPDSGSDANDAHGSSAGTEESNDDLVKAIQDALGSGPEPKFAVCPRCGHASGVESVQPIPVADRRQANPSKTTSDSGADRRVGPRRDLDRDVKDPLVSLQPIYKCLSCDFEWRRAADQANP